ncbi:hypothetical protein O181_080984 [Austropuccinia psidii MF-1]|uniref:Uncharacterized protein n=1 Tax=Austropuccinia psidii MF-1 TaxID=1389203 RepID=A0A9Q3IJP2_9BASI|nr:hypothetical protein [Austropuccinia psidii MF-1]
MMSLLGFSHYYRQHLKDLAIHARSLYRICDQQTVFEMTQERIQAYEKIRYAFTNAQLLLMPDWKSPFKMYIHACGEGPGEALHQLQIVKFVLFQDKSNLLRPDIEAAKWSAFALYGLWKNLIIILIVAPNRHMIRWPIAIKEYRGNMTIVHKSGNIYKNAYGLSKWELPITPQNPAYFPTGAVPQIAIEGMTITDFGKDFFDKVRDSYELDKSCHILTSLLDKD